MAKKSKKSKVKSEEVVEEVETSSSPTKQADDGKWKELGFKSLDHYNKFLSKNFSVLWTIQTLLSFQHFPSSLQNQSLLHDQGSYCKA